MGVYGRVARGVEAGVIAAGVVELSFFVLDVVHLRPLSTPFALAGAAPGPAGLVVDLTTLSGVMDGLWAAYQVVVLTCVHFVTFGLVGVLAAVLFDWSRLGVGRLAVVAVLCTLAFYLTVSLSGSVVALESVGMATLIGVNALAALALGGALRLVSGPDEGASPA